MSDLIIPDWPAPDNVKAVSSTRQGGYSLPPYQSLNLGNHVGDDPSLVLQNRRSLQRRARMPAVPYWLNQTHSATVLTLPSSLSEPDADATFSNKRQQICTVMTADCLPVLFCNREGTAVAAAHAGWRGLCNGILENTVRHFSKPAEVIAWLGPAISVAAFEVGTEVRQAFISHQLQAEQAFVAQSEHKWRADLYLLARQRLASVGVTAVYGGDYCTFTQQQRFFSYRRDGLTGRMASCIWLE
ncbi:peptidoglycan editing factor PgeF [Chromatiaceae bacterium AAb-1]|nr:peptidoglycan editing factor PgeF [Chromatiaceae bacterium AAb-1]